MVASPLLDKVLESAQKSGRSTLVASKLIHAALTALQEIEDLDESLAPDDPLEFDRQTAASLREMYQRWAKEAEALLQRIGLVEKRNGGIAGSKALRDAHGKTMARLSISLDDMEEGLRDIAEGRTVPMEEVRRELRLRVHQAGTETIPPTRRVPGRGNTRRT
jgi:predicted transcriptional regulator